MTTQPPHRIASAPPRHSHSHAAIPDRPDKPDLPSPNTGALRRSRVVDASRILGGPYCGQILGDHADDVLIENFKTGTLEKWGLGYDVLSQRLPRRVHCRVSGEAGGAPLLTVPAALQHPHTRHRGMVVELPGYRGLGSPIMLSRRSASYRTPPLAEGDRCWPRDSANDGSANASHANANASANANANANADPANDDGQIDR